MQALLTILNFLLPSANECYLDNNILDPRTNATLKQISIEIAKDTGISVNKAQQYLSCSKKNTYTAKRTTNTSKPVSAFCQFNKRLVDPYRVKQGAKFYRQHQSLLTDAARQFNVDPIIITAIIGAESNYGNFTGNHSVKESIATVIANTCQDDHSPNHYKNSGVSNKHTFFVRELKSLIHMDIDYGIDTKNLKGSWDGGIGLAQFMPYSYLNFSYSTHRATPDLFSPDDAIFSIANYLHKNGGWKNTQTARRYTPSPEEVKQLTNKDKISLTSGDHQHIYRFALNDNTQEYWLTDQNFETIRQYNPRPHYAINIHLLAEAIRDHINSHPE